MSVTKPTQTVREHPQVTVSKSGVHSVRAADILRSEIGRRVIERTVHAGIASHTSLNSLKKK